MQTQMQGARTAAARILAWLSGWLIMMAGVPVQAAGVSDYWTLEQYYQTHQEQRSWLAELEQAVRGNPVPVSPKLQQRAVKIAQVYPGLQASSYWSDSEQALVGRLNDLGINYQLQTRYTSPNTQLDEQIRQIRELLDWKPDYLIYTLDSARQKLLIERLIQNADTKLILQNITTPLKAWGERQPFLYVGFDHVEGGRLLAQHFMQRFPRASYGVLFRSKGLVSQLRGTGFIQTVPEEHRLRSSYFSDSSRNGGREATMRMLEEYPDLTYIYACSTDVALGALDALELLQRKDIVVNGWGGGPEEVEQLRQGRLPVVLMRLNDEAGIAIAEAVRRDLEGQPVPRVFSGRFVVLDESMSESDIRHHEARAHRYSGGRDD